MNYYRSLLLLLLIGITQASSAQKKVLLKMAFTPDKTYKTEIVNLMDMEMNVKGDSAMLAQIQASGMQLPIIMKMNQVLGTTTKAGAERADKKVPLLMTFDKMEVSQTVGGQESTQDNNPFANAIIEGTALEDGKIAIDTIKGEIDNALKTSLRQTVNTMQANIKYPKEELKIGDSFDQEMPMSIPIPEANMKMIIAIKYILKEIKDDKAIFDLKQTISMDVNRTDKNSNANGIGNGTGTMTYNISKKIAEESVSDIKFQFEFNISGLTMAADCNAKTTTKVTVE